METGSSRGESAKSHKVIGAVSLSKKKTEISPYRKKKNPILSVSSQLPLSGIAVENEEETVFKH